MFAVLIVTVNDLVKESIVRRALSLFLKTTRAVISVPALEPKAAIGSEDSAAGKTVGIIQLVTNCLAEFTILASSCGDSLVLRIIELVNGA